MRYFAPLCLLFPLIFSLFLTNCGKDDDPVAPDPVPEACSIEVISPYQGWVFQTSDEITIRWNATGSESSVIIELYKSDAMVGVIDAETLNDGRYIWPGSTMGQEPGNDFNIKVTATGDPNCGGYSPTFCFDPTEDCELTFSDSSGDTLVAGAMYEISWSSYHSSGYVDILLVNWDDTIGTIASRVQDTGSFSWLVDSFHFGTYDFYMMRIEDSSVVGCSDQVGYFRIEDDDICEISISQPSTMTEWVLGETQFILYNFSDEVEFINIQLYSGTIFLGNIATNHPVGGGFYEWEVTNFGFMGPADYYKVRIENVADPYCDEESVFFPIH